MELNRTGQPTTRNCLRFCCSNAPSAALQPFDVGHHAATEIVTNHKDLQAFFTTKTPSARQARAAEELSQYDNIIAHNPGKVNPADGPLRTPDYSVNLIEAEQNRMLSHLKALFGSADLSRNNEKALEENEAQLAVMQLRDLWRPPKSRLMANVTLIAALSLHTVDAVDVSAMCVERTLHSDMVHDMIDDPAKVDQSESGEGAAFITRVSTPSCLMNEEPSIGRQGTHTVGSLEIGTDDTAVDRSGDSAQAPTEGCRDSRANFTPSCLI